MANESSRVQIHERMAVAKFVGDYQPGMQPEEIVVAEDARVTIYHPGDPAWEGLIAELAPTWEVAPEGEET